MSNRPTPAEFGLISIDLAELERIESTANNSSAGISWMDSVLPKGKGVLAGLIGMLLVFTVLWPFFLLGLLSSPIIQAMARTRLHIHPKYERYRAFEDAVIQHEKSKRDFWLSLSGISFEHQLGDLYRRLGFSVKVTKGSGDQGVDIVLIGNGKKSLCSASNIPVPSVRQLFENSMEL